MPIFEIGNIVRWKANAPYCGGQEGIVIKVINKGRYVYTRVTKLQTNGIPLFRVGERCNDQAINFELVNPFDPLNAFEEIIYE